MTLTTISTFPFNFNKDETDPTLRFPEIALRAYSFNIQISNNFYIVRVNYNYWANSPQVSIFGADGNPIVSNAPLIEKLTDIWPNYLYGNSAFSGYYLFWEINNQQFTFCKDA